MITTGQNILKTLGYFDLFQYPLNREEICLFHADEIPASLIDEALVQLQKDKRIFRFEEFYALQDDLSLVQRRRKGNLLAIKQLETAKKVARFLSAFPFIKGIAVSGSLSKNFATEKTDIDFFIITAANRLWIARSFMHLYKKLTFLTGRQHWFCMNYYIDEEGLEITEKNIFTAMAIVTLLPMQGCSSLDKCIANNEWTKKYFPARHFMTGDIPEIRSGWFRTVIEKIFSRKVGDAADKWLMNITDKRWQKKARLHRLNSKGGDMGMKVGRHFSKPDPKNFQDKVVERYRTRIQQLLQPQQSATQLVV